MIRLALALGALALGACAPSGGSAAVESTASPVEFTKHDRLLAVSVLAGNDTALFLNTQQVDSFARAIASIRLLGDTAISMFLANDPDDYWMETVFLGTTLPTEDRDTLVAPVARCIARATVASPPNPARQGAVFPVDCWPALAAVLAPVTDADVRVHRSSGEILGLTIWTDLPIDRYALARRLDAAFPDAFIGPSALMAHWPYFELERFEDSWRFIFWRGYMDCVGGCGKQHVYLYRYNPVTRRAWKEGECGEPLPDNMAQESFAPGRDLRLVYCPAGVSRREYQAPRPELAFTTAPRDSTRF